MKVLKRILERIDGVVGFPIAYAHCDIPCGIYDPYAAQVAAHTVVRMDMLIADVMKNGAQSAVQQRKFQRHAKPGGIQRHPKYADKLPC